MKFLNVRLANHSKSIMSQQITRSVNDRTGKSKQTAQSYYHPVWMARWMRTSNNTASDRLDLSARPKEELESLKETETKIRFRKNLESGKYGINFPSKIIPAGEGTSNDPHKWMKTRYSDKGKGAELIHGREMDSNHSESGISLNACLRDFENTAMSFGRDCSRKMKQFSSGNCVCNLGTMRICTTVDSIEATSVSCPTFSHRTPSELITKKAGVNLSRENDVFRATWLVKKNDENKSRELSLTPFFGQNNGGVKLRSLSSSSDSEGVNNVCNVEGHRNTMKNESRAETDTMKMNFFKEGKMNSGANSSLSTKAFNIDSISTPPIAVALSIGNNKHQWTNTDINLELPALPAVVSFLENHCPSSSRTLEMDILLAGTKQTKLKSNIKPDALDLSNRWVKRLRVSFSKSNSSSQGTKMSNPAGNLSHDKKRNYFRSTLDSNITSSEPSPRNTYFPGEEFTVDTRKKAKELLLSHVWIKRWLRNGLRVTEEKPNLTVEEVGESRHLKMSVGDDDELEKKQLPSIGAMARMVKAMRDFQSCEIQKRGSITVWNTKEAF